MHVVCSVLCSDVHSVIHLVICSVVRLDVQSFSVSVVQLFNHSIILLVSHSVVVQSFCRSNNNGMPTKQRETNGQLENEACTAVGAAARDCGKQVKRI